MNVKQENLTMEYKEANNRFSLIIFSSLLLGLIFSAISLIFNERLFSLLGGLIDLILNYVFIYLLDFGIKGAALSTLIGNVTSTTLCVLYFMSKKSTLKFVLPPLDFRILKATVWVVLFYLKITVQLPTYKVKLRTR